MHRRETDAPSPQSHPSIQPGDRFGKLVAVGFASNTRNSGLCWTFQCDCGKVIAARVRAVTATHTKRGPQRSCGCAKFDNIRGHKFGRLTAIEHAGRRNTMSMWRCMCDCGTDTIVSSANLQGGGVKSCGCLVAKAAIMDSSAPQIADEYAAGYVDGDGSVVAVRQKRSGAARSRSDYYKVDLYATGSDVVVLASFQNTYGGAARVQRETRGTNWRDNGMWRTAINHASRILPHLIVKHRQARLGMELVARLGKHHGLLSHDEIAQRERLHSEIRTINADLGCPHEVRPLSIAYAAGFFDAEGTIGTVRSGTSWRITATVTNNCRCILDCFTATFGGSVRRGKDNSWRWEIKGGKATDFIRAICPYLITKKLRAEVAEQFSSHVGPMHTGRLSPDARTAREMLRNQLLILNQKGAQMTMFPAA